jgi:hypothetical protein
MPETRVAFADANWLFGRYDETRASAMVKTWASRGPSTLIVSGPVLAECRCNFWRAGDRALALESDLRPAAPGLWLHLGGPHGDVEGLVAALRAALQRWHSGCPAPPGGETLWLPLVSFVWLGQRLPRGGNRARPESIPGVERAGPGDPAPITPVSPGAAIGRNRDPGFFSMTAGLAPFRRRRSRRATAPPRHGQHLG